MWCGHFSGPGAGKPSARNLRTRAQPLPADRLIMTHFNKGPSYGLSAEVKNKVRLGKGGAGPRGQRWDAGRRPGDPGTGVAWAALRPVRLVSGGLRGEEMSGRRESRRASPTCPRLQAPAPGLSSGFVPAPRAGTGGGRWVPGLLESRSACLRLQERVCGCRTHPSGKGALLRGHSPLGGVSPRGWGPSEQPPPPAPARAPGRP